MNMRIEIPVSADGPSPVTLASIPLLPAGSFTVSTRGMPHAMESIYAGSDDEPFVLTTARAELLRGVRIDLPVPVRALTIRAPTAAGVSAIELRPAGSRDQAYVGIGRSADATLAHHAAAYGTTSVFFLDDRTTPEADGFWVWGAREGAVVFDPRLSDLTLTLRNGAVQNDVTILDQNREQHLSLQPGEARRITIPASPRRADVTRIRTSAGFRPSEVDPHSQDQRFLGVYVVMPDHANR